MKFISEKDFLEIVAAVCEHPRMYTPTGTFYEVASFLEGHATSVNVRNAGYHKPLTPFRKWLVKQLSIEKTIIDWVEYRELFSSDLEAFDRLSILYKEFVDDVDHNEA